MVLLQGARQTGKSTLAESLAEGEYPARYLTFDDAALLATARHDPAGFVAGLHEPVVLDDIQHAPELFPTLKARADRDRRPGRFLLTSSANVTLLPRFSESLSGRMKTFTLWPLSQGEIEERMESFVDVVFSATLPPLMEGLPDRSELVRRMLRGGYPEALMQSAESRRNVWFSSYLTTLLHRDVRDLANIEGLTALPRLLAVLAARIMALTNFAELSRSISLPLSTLKRYMALLETTFLVQMLPAWSGKGGKRLVKAPRLLLGDTGLIAHLLGADSERLLSKPELFGPLLENFVAMELLKQLAWSRVRASLSHFRTQTGQESDLVLEEETGRIVGIDVKASATVSAQDFKGLRTLSELAGKRFRRGVVLYTGSTAIPFGTHLHAVPVGALWHLGATRDKEAG